MTAHNIAQRFLNPERNLGGADWATRIFAALLIAALTVIVLPQLEVPYPLLKISVLSASELGLGVLMLGMFLRSKTYYAGFTLFLASVCMFAAIAKGHHYTAFVIGVVFFLLACVEIITRRSRFNALFGIKSTSATPSTSALVEAALEEDKPGLAKGA